ncbi:MAG: uncharacterized protein H6R06_1262 [Proteobacteria bacterium]|nr:uncharacterized protein [Pseudomonadota bacterium]
MLMRRALLLVMWVLTGTLGAPAGTAAATVLRGVLQSGGTAQIQPIAGVEVSLLDASDARPSVVGRARSDALGRFTIVAAKERAEGVFYLQARLGADVVLLTVIGPELPATATVNELTSVAASYSMAQFLSQKGITGEPDALRIAATMGRNLVSPASGESSPVLLSPPNADQTNSLRSTRSLANLLAACVHDRRVARRLLELTRAPRGSAPQDTAQALAALARDPGLNVEPIYQLSLLRDAYTPALQRLPDAWTLTVKVNDSGDDTVLFGGPANLAFDSRGYAWITNNVTQGLTTSSHAIMVLRPDGKPADGTRGTPRSPIVDPSIIGTGFGVDVDPQGAVWFGNFGWGGVNPEPPQGSIVKLSPSGQILSGTTGFLGGPYRAQATVSDARGNIWIASFGNDSVHVFPEGDPERSVGHRLYPGSGPFGIAIAPDGSAWVSNSGGLAGAYPSSVARFSFVEGRLHRHFLRRVGKGLKGLGVDSRGNAWVASLGDSKVYALRPDGSLIGGFSGGGIDGPWDVTVDGDDNLWVANFGPLQPRGDFPNNFANGRLSKLAGIDPARRPPGTQTGAALSPDTGYTVASAGSPVLLHNGDPLYGPGAPPSFSPMMRQTAAVIDRAGNIWSINNWKPLFAVDQTANPGGDGIVIFVGLGAPPRAPR